MHKENLQTIIDTLIKIMIYIQQVKTGIVSSCNMINHIVIVAFLDS